MRLFFISVLLVLSVQSARSDKSFSFSINGRIENYSYPAKIFLTYKDVYNKIVEDSCIVNQGTFSISGKLDYPVLVNVYLAINGKKEDISQKDRLQFYLDEGDIEIKSTSAYLWDASVEGSKTQDLNKEFLHSVRPIQIKADRIQDIYNNATPKMRENVAFIDSLNKEFEQVGNEYNTAGLTFIIQHPKDMLSIYMLQSQIEHYPNDLNVEPVFNLMSEELQNSAPGKKLEGFIKMYKTLNNGETAPDFEAIDIYGNNIKLSDLRGKIIFLVFWSPSCNHCINEIPFLQQAYQLYKDQDFLILSFAIEEEENKQKWLEVSENKQMNWLSVSDLKGWNSKIVDNYKVYSTPKNYLLNKNGIIINKELYENNLLKELNTLFTSNQLNQTDCKKQKTLD